MQPESHRGRKWRRFVRQYAGKLFLFLLIVVIVALVAGLFYVMSSGKFILRK